MLSALLLDGGRGFRICVAAILAHWLCVAIICSRNQTTVSKLDVFLVRWGFVPSLILAVLIANQLY